MKVSIIVISWNTRDLLRRCLASIFEAEPGFPSEVWVVDNASTDQSVEMLRSEFPQVRRIQNSANLGFACANNQAMRQAQGEYYLLLNSDTIVQPGALHRLLQAAERYPDAGIVGGMLLNADGSIQESWAKFPTLASEWIGKNLRRRREIDPVLHLYETDWVGGACLLARRQAVEQVGLLDETFFMYSEEVDWCYRMKSGGWKVYYLQSAPITHLGGGSANRTEPAQLIRLYQSKLRFFEKHYGCRSANWLRVGLFWVYGMRLRWSQLASRLSFSRTAGTDGLAAPQRQLVNWLADPAIPIHVGNQSTSDDV